jgi:cysteinyl-tRNA synthetase
MHLRSDRYKVLAYTLKSLGSTLGLLERSAKVFFQGGLLTITAEDIGSAYCASVPRPKKRKTFNFQIKYGKELLEQGIILEDKPGGITTWRKE